MNSVLSSLVDRRVPTIAATALVPEAIALLGETEQSCILVVEPEQAQLIGLFTERDVVRLIASGSDVATCLVSAAMSEPSVTLSEVNLPEMEDLLALFEHHHLKTLPIVNDQAQPVGIITAISLWQQLGSRTLDSPKETHDRQQREDYLPTEIVLRRHLKRALMLQKITDAMRTQSNPQQIFEIIVTHVKQIFGVSYCHLFTYTKTSPHLATLARYPALTEGTDQFSASIAIEHPLLLRMLMEDRAIVSSNVAADPLLQSMKSLCGQVGQQSMLAVRTSYQGQPNGMLVLCQCHHSRQWMLSETQLAEAIAAQIGIVLAQIKLLEQEKQQREELDRQNLRLQQEIHDRRATQYELQQTREQLEMFFAQSLDGFFFMMLDHPVPWDDTIDQEKTLDYVFAHQRITKVNDAMLNQYGANREQFLGRTPHDFFAHDLSHGRQMWKQLFDAGTLHIQTNEQRLDGTPIKIEGDYTCFYDSQGRIIGHFGVQRDVTERNRAEDELRRSEERWQLVIQASNDGIFDLDLTTGYCFYSKRFKEILGYAEQDFAPTREQWRDLLHPDDRASVLAAKEAYLHRRIPNVAYEYRLRCRDGSYKWVFDRLLAVWNEAGDPVRVVGVSTDISDRKHAEAIMQKQQEFLRHVIDSPPNLIFAKDWNGKFVLANQATAEIYGTTVENLLGKTDADFNPNLTEVEHFLEDDRDVIRTRQPKLIEETVTSATGECRCFQTIKKPIMSLDGQSMLVLGIATDISDRKQTEITLAKRERYLAVLVEIQNLLLASTTDQTHYIEILRQLGLASGASRVYLFENHRDAANNLLMSQRAEWCAQGITPELNNPIWQNLAYQDFCPRWETTLSQGDIINSSLADFPESERQLLEPMGILAILILPLMVGGQFFGFIGFDNCTTPQAWESLEISLLNAAAAAISLHQERKQAEEFLAVLLVQTQEQSLALEKARDAAEAANRAKSEFLANMSHELRTPLNAILGFTQIMGRDKLLSPDNQEYVGIINRSGQHLLELINDVLEMSKIEAGRLKLHPNSVDLYYLLDTLYEMLHLKASSKRLLLTFDRSPNLPQYIITDEGKLRQVLLNLLGNAIKFTRSGHVALRVSVKGEEVSVKGEDVSVKGEEVRIEDEELNLLSPTPYTLQFEIEDTGFGIAPTDLKQLFRPFVQTHTGQQTSEGTGLGLTISQKFVQLMGGEITVESVFGQGSTFRFSIQTTLAQEMTLSTSFSSQRVIGLAPGQPNSRLLIVEDRWENQQILVKMLQPLGFELQVANNGQEGIAAWEQWQPHGILMDMRMPVMDGYEATQQIRAREHDRRNHYQDGYDFPVFSCLTKIIAVTSSAFDEERSAILKIGCDDFISKPFREEELLAKLAQHLNLHYRYETQPGIEEIQREQQASVPSVSLSIDNQFLLDTLCLGGMSREWILQMHQAAILGRDRQMLKLIDQIPNTDSNLVQALRELVKDFRFEEIVDLTTLNQLEEANNE